MPSDIQAFVQWKKPTVFAGEEVECVITFRNTAPKLGERDGEKRLVRQRSRLDTLRPEAGRPRATTQSTVFTKPLLNRASSVFSGHTASYRAHKPSLSLNVAPNSSHSRTPSSASAAQLGGNKPSPGHGRSLSIMSLGSDTQKNSVKGASPGASFARRGRPHGRSASMQIMTRGSPQVSPPISTSRPLCALSHILMRLRHRTNTKIVVSTPGSQHSSAGRSQISRLYQCATNQTANRYQDHTRHPRSSTYRT